jgi:hypothetical protein
MDLWSPTELELYVRSRASDRELERSNPVPPPALSFWTVRRRRLARRLIGLGLRIDAEASRAALRPEATTQINGSDA